MIKKEDMKGIFHDRADDFAEKAIILKDKAKSNKGELNKQIDKAKYNIAKKYYGPIFDRNIDIKDYKLLRIISADMLPESDVCDGAIGQKKTIKQMDVLYLINKEAVNMGIDFYPNLEETIYFVSPYHSRMCIALDEYFDYIKKAKADELQMVAHKLGARHVKITFKEERHMIVSNKRRTFAKYNENNKGAATDSAKVDYEKSEEQYSKIDVVAENNYDECVAPERPVLRFFANDTDINGLIDMRMDATHELKKKTYTFKSGNEVKSETAIKIDAVLKQLKMSGNTSVESEHEASRRTILEYEIEF